MPRVRPSSNEFGDRVYQPSCECGWFGRSFYTTESAEQSLSAHECPASDGRELDPEGDTT